MHSSRTGSYNCRIQLQQCLAIVVRKEGCKSDPGDFWMYENGYLLFQGLLSSNSVCWWNTALNGATKSLVYYGYINPGALLVGSEPCALEILRNAWARRVLQPPPGYQIVALEDIEDCAVSPVAQTQWTPLPEAVCAVVLRLSSQGRPAGIETIREALIMAFPHVSPPSEHALYDTLVQLTKERKLYNTSSGYFIVTPEKRRSRSQSRGRKIKDDLNDPPTSNKTMLMSADEAVLLVHGDMTTIRDGNVTHQCIQTNLADVICGGNASDKILYPRNKRRSASFPSRRSPDRRGSFRLWSSNRRLRRSASTRTLAKHYVESSSSTEYPSGESTPTPTPKKESLLTRLFRRSKRSQCHIGTFGSQFPPSEWFNSKAVHLHNVGTQTSISDKDSGICINSYLESCDNIISSRSATLPRHRRQLSSDLTFVTSLTGSRENSPISRYTNSYATSTLPRKYRSRDSSRKTSRASLKEAKSAGDPVLDNTTKLLPDHNSEQETANSVVAESKTSQKTNDSCDDLTTESPSPVKNSSSIDNSGPSSIESGSKTGSSITSGPSSIESHKTVINRILDSPRSNDSKRRHQQRIKDGKLKASQKITAPAAISHSNSFTLQVTTNQGVNLNNKGAATTTATINGGASNTKIFVQNSPVRSVITFENKNAENKQPNLVIINGSESSSVAKPAEDSEKILIGKNTNFSLNNSKEKIDKIIPNNDTNNMNNNRKLSLQLPGRDLSYHNLIKNVSSASHNQFNNSNSNPDSPLANTFREFSKNCSLITGSNPPSPTKSYEGIPLEGKYNKNEVWENGKLTEKNIIGSEPNICYKNDIEQSKSLSRENSYHQGQFPSLSDLSFNFTSLAAQKILKGVSINSVDTLVELNMAANVEKQNNCDVVHTDFGLF